MSEFTDEIDNSEVICPYCNYAYEPECESFDEEERSKECDSCGMKFHHVDEISYDHFTRPDCKLNGLIHKWESISLSNGLSHDFCEICGGIRPILRS